MRQEIALPIRELELEWDPARGTFVQPCPDRRRALAAAGAVAAGAVQILGRRRRSLAEIMERLGRQVAERFA